MIRIAHIITGLYSGGAESMLYKLLQKTDRTRFTPFVLSLLDKGSFGAHIESLGIPVYTLDLSPYSFFRDVRVTVEAISLLRTIRPHLIQSWMYHANVFASLVAPFLPDSPPVLWNIRQTLYNMQQEKSMTRWVIWLSAFLSKMPRYLIYNSPLSATQHEQQGFSPKQRVIIANGFDTQHFLPSIEKRRAWRNTLGWTDDQVLIGLAARYHPMKDHCHFLEAAAQCASLYPMVHFVLVGRGVESHNETLKDVIERLHLSHRVSLLGERFDMDAFFQAMDIVSLASAWGEGFPNVLGEAMATGVPCVTTDVGESGVIVGDTGYVVPASCPDALASALAKCVELGPKGRNLLGMRARQRIIERYSLSAIVEQYENRYSSLISPH